MQSVGHDKFILMFTPDLWTSPFKFRNFLGAPYKATAELRHAIQSCIDHTRKYDVFDSLANRIRPTLLEDMKELEENGFTHANCSNEYAALVEALFCELYSILDGLRHTMYWIFPNVRGLQKKSTSKFFSRAVSGEYSSDFPEEIRVSLAEAYDTWFLKLRRLRTELTHGGVGSCHLDKTTQIVSYLNHSLAESRRECIIEDVTKKLLQINKAVFTLQDYIFDYLYSRLEPIESTQICGFYKGRAYIRSAVPELKLNRDSGKCFSSQSFTDEYYCPLSDTCAAYKS